MTLKDAMQEWPASAIKMSTLKRSASTKHEDWSKGSSTPKVKRAQSLVQQREHDSSPILQRDQKPTFAFKNPNFEHSGVVKSGKKRSWKSLKNVAASERSQAANQDLPTYSNIDAPPSFKPVKKYSDVSGLTAPYTDPHTGLYYSTTDEYRTVRQLPQDIVHGYLALRNKLHTTAFPWGWAKCPSIFEVDLSWGNVGTTCKEL